MNHTEAAQYIKATLTAFGPGEAISMTKETWAKIHEAMQALAQPEQEPVAWFRYETVYEYKNQLARCTKDCIGAFPVYTTPPQPEQSQVEETLRYEIDALETKLAECRAQQPEQKPVAWPVGWVDDGGTVFWKDKPPADGADLYTVIDKSAAIRIATSLGWTPQRTWVGLTGFEQKELMAMSARDAVFATEAKLKEKNT